MIRKGVNVNVTADSPAVAGTTPLHVAWVQIAVEEGRTEVLELRDI